LHFQIIPEWVERHADAWEEEVRTRRLGHDEDFTVMARRNAENRGDSGTHCAGNCSYECCEGKTVCIHLFSIMVILDTHNISFRDAEAKAEPGEVILDVQ
jgi:hypothetical protein